MSKVASKIRSTVAIKENIKPTIQTFLTKLSSFFGFFCSVIFESLSLKVNQVFV